MSRTSVKSYTLGGLLGGFIITMIILGVYSIPNVFNNDGFSNTSFNDFDNLTDYATLANSTSTSTYDTTVDSGIFDVLGGLVVKSLEAIKTFFNSINFMTSSVSSILNTLGIGVALKPVTTYIVTVIGISLAIYFLFKVINKTEDEK